MYILRENTKHSPLFSGPPVFRKDHFRAPAMLHARSHPPPKTGKDVSRVRTPFSGEVITHPDRLLIYTPLTEREKDMVCSKIYLGNDLKMKQ